MSTYVGEAEAQEAADKGALIGKLTPCAETKWTWFEVYRHEGKLFAVVMSPGYGVSCGELISESEIPLYCDVLP